MSKLSLKNIYKIYPGDVLAVKDFNLEIDDKDFIVFVGPSGCGKSTTLRMIAGLEDISKGELIIDNKVVNDIEPKDRDISMVFQSYALYPHMTVFDNMAFALKLRKLPKEVISNKVINAAKTLEIEGLLDRKPKELSGGQRQRVALGRAIVREPKVFLMDEPLSNLDAKLRVQMRKEITDLHKRLNATIIYVTHDQVEAMTMGTKIVVMKDGEIQQVDSAMNLYNKPKNKFVASFIGSPQMNFIESNVREEESNLICSFGDHEISLPKGNLKMLQDNTFTIGIRPENLIISYDEQPNSIPCTVNLCEVTGADSYIYCVTDNGTKLIAKMCGNIKLLSGTKVYLTLELNKLHLFDKYENNIL